MIESAIPLGQALLIGVIILIIAFVVVTLKK